MDTESKLEQALEILRLSYSDMIVSGENREIILIKENGLFGLYNVDTMRLIAPTYKQIIPEKSYVIMLNWITNIEVYNIKLDEVLTITGKEGTKAASGNIENIHGGFLAFQWHHDSNIVIVNLNTNEIVFDGLVRKSNKSSESSPIVYYLCRYEPSNPGGDTEYGVSNTGEFGTVETLLKAQYKEVKRKVRNGVTAGYDVTTDSGDVITLTKYGQLY